MRDARQAAPSDPGNDNGRRGRFILGLAVPAAAAYFVLGVVGDLRDHLIPYLATHAVLIVGMLAAWRLARRDHRTLQVALGAALLFRLVATAGQPALSDDVYRYMWDGQVQLHGVHPYRHAPADESLSALRDDDWERINHPELKTIYPPLSQLVFLLLAALDAGPVGFKLAMGLVDFGVVLLLLRLLRRQRLPPERVLLYAWNPLAVMESAGSGHLEPLGIFCVLLAIVWAVEGRNRFSAVALAAGVQVKLLPIVLAPGHARRVGVAASVLFVVVLGVLWLPYLATGPAVGSGLYAYAERWEHNASVYAGVQALMERVDTAARLGPGVRWLQDRVGGDAVWERLYRYVWPREVARLLSGLALVLWSLWLVSRRLADPVRESLLVLGAVLVLAPTVHPWYVLWVLPLAAARRSWGWLAFSATVPLAYWGGGAGDVPLGVRAVEYLLPVTVALVVAARSRRTAAR